MDVREESKEEELGYSGPGMEILQKLKESENQVIDPGFS